LKGKKGGEVYKDQFFKNIWSNIQIQFIINLNETVMKKTLMYFGAILLLLMVFTNCKEDEKTTPDPDPVVPTLPDISVIDISAETGWDYCVAGKEDYYYIESTETAPQSVLYHSAEAQKDYAIFMDAYGMLDKVEVDDYVFIFKNFNGTKVDLGIVKPDGEIAILRELETGYDWDEAMKSLKDLDGTEAWSDVVRWTGRIVGGVPCALSVAATSGTAGIAAPVAAWTCGNYLLGLSADIASNEFEVDNGFTQFVEVYGTASTVFDCQSGLDPLGCATGAASTALGNLANSIEEIENRSEQVQSIDAALNYGYGDVQITLTWTNGADLDLHVIDPSGEEIYWQDPYSASGGVLDVDDTDGYGPENIYWPKDEAPEGIYKVSVHHYPWTEKPKESSFNVLINAYGQTKSYSGSTTEDQTVHVVDFDKNGFGTPFKGKVNITINHTKQLVK